MVSYTNVLFPRKDMHSSLKTFYGFGNLSGKKPETSEFGYHFEAYEKVCCDKEEPSFKFSFFVMSTHKISRYCFLIGRNSKFD